MLYHVIRWGASAISSRKKDAASLITIFLACTPSSSPGETGLRLFHLRRQTVATRNLVNPMCILNRYLIGVPRTPHRKLLRLYSERITLFYYRTSWPTGLLLKDENLLESLSELPSNGTLSSIVLLMYITNKGFENPVDKLWQPQSNVKAVNGQRSYSSLFLPQRYLFN